MSLEGPQRIREAIFLYCLWLFWRKSFYWEVCPKIWKCWKYNILKKDAAKFKTAFNDAKEFNKAVKTGGELKHAPVISEKEEDGDKKEEKKESKEEKIQEENK